MNPILDLTFWGLAGWRHEGHHWTLDELVERYPDSREWLIRQTLYGALLLYLSALNLRRQAEELTTVTPML